MRVRCFVFTEFLRKGVFMNGKNYESVFNNVGQSIELSLIDDFPSHPYKVIDNSDMTELTESIKSNGLLNPIIVRKKQTVGMNSFPATAEKGYMKF